jgi:hypothetical protein
MQINTVELHERNGTLKIIDSREYSRMRRLELLSPDGKILLSWLQRRNKQVISMVEIAKCLMPVSLRSAATIRQMMGELMRLGFVESKVTHIIYAGRTRKENWTILDRVPPAS